LQASGRNYKDDNDKPEVAVALTEFWMLHGFRPLEQIAEMFRTVPELQSIMPDFPEKLAHTENTVQAHRALLQDLYRAVMTTPQDCIDLLLNTLITRLARTDTSDKNDPGHWVVRASQTFCPVGGHCDRGIFSIYLLNLVHLGPGQGTFQPAGTLHAYLEGVTVELMANSDNVLRGGLTSKHVDVPGLMRILCFDSDLPLVMNGVLNAVRAGAWERIYQTPSDEFELSSIDLESGTQYLGNAVQGPDTIIVLSGNATLAANGHCTVFSRGTIIFAPFGAHYVLHATGDRAILFKASVPSRAG
jgi:mannose-6-phosphate isomerase